MFQRYSRSESSVLFYAIDSIQSSLRFSYRERKQESCRGGWHGITRVHTRRRVTRIRLHALKYIYLRQTRAYIYFGVHGQKERGEEGRERGSDAVTRS